MSKYLVIVESPAKAKTIEKFLGKNYTVLASVGHVRDLPKSKMGIDIENEFEPAYINIRGKGPVLKELRKYAKKADKVFLATDPDREGEAIAWHLAFILGIDLDEPCRVTFNEITKATVKEAIKHPTTIKTDLVDAQQARRVLDRLVGYSISPLLWRKVRKGLSAGRVQSVATKMICDRENLINAFEKEEYWSLDFNFQNQDKLSFKASYIGQKGEKAVFKSESDVQKVMDDLDKSAYTVKSIQTKEKSRKPQACFTTSRLQQEASNKLGFSTKKTMIVAQQLYEGIKLPRVGSVGLITYMRTDSTRIADTAVAAVQDFVKEEFGENYLGPEVKVKNNKNAQDAHEAIRATDVMRTPESIEGYLTKDQNKLYKLIWERFVASLMAPAKFEALTVDIENGDHLIRSTGSTQVFDGYLKVYSFGTSTDKILPKLSEGEALSLEKILPEQHFTQPPARYTEATLVREMEEKGIGRPSTYAPTISTVISRGYVGREKKHLYPTELGNIINEIMENYFERIIEVNFTADMEMQFDQVEDGEMPWKSVIKTFYGPFESLIEKAEEDIEKVDLTEPTDIPCELCGNMMNIKHGRFGKFLACSNYPDCKNTKPILKKIGVTCPECGVGDIVERKTKKFKTFYGCSEFPNCNFMSWHKPVDKKCPKCSKTMIEYKTKKKHEYKCTDKECGYSEEISEN
ncbi:type I DNA topoisomerase [Acidaminobacter sp. JC074]|uniref:type I DNA topoisomerase n=1 Tax=Acidaminobacter sp. JC074 TaxID=2530199 RepID=UPI001F105E3C|nr:type I DNA topoisomerase [Acidaminobacter sp. JC074]MCH4888712.1 type I DNA topoisomerase [Acidaminobacter sp. JC074]